MNEGPYVYKRRVAFHETDCMGVVHHSNHIKYFEEARVDWLRTKGLTGLHIPQGPCVFAVVDVTCEYMNTAKFDDELTVVLQGRMEGLRMFFEYAIWSEPKSTWIAKGRTTLVALDAALRIARPPREVTETFAQENWSETWPPTAPPHP